MPYVEYRVRPVTRFIVTRFEAPCDPSNVPNNVPPVGCSSTKGEFDNEETAHAVAYALAREEHERLGYPVRFTLRPSRSYQPHDAGAGTNTQRQS